MSGVGKVIKSPDGWAPARHLDSHFSAVHATYGKVTGELVVTDAGLAVEGTARAGFKKMHVRVPLAEWASVRSVEILDKSGMNIIAGTSFKTTSCELVVRGAKSDGAPFLVSYKIHANPSELRNVLGTYIAQVEARNTGAP